MVHALQLRVRGQHGLLSELLESQGYTEEPGLEKTSNNNNNNKKQHSSTVNSSTWEIETGRSLKLKTSVVYKDTVPNTHTQTCAHTKINTKVKLFLSHIGSDQAKNYQVINLRILKW